jgi:hypothetical protein
MESAFRPDEPHFDAGHHAHQPRAALITLDDEPVWGLALGERAVARRVRQDDLVLALQRVGLRRTRRR